MVMAATALRPTIDINTNNDSNRGSNDSQRRGSAYPRRVLTLNVHLLDELADALADQHSDCGRARWAVNRVTGAVAE